MARNNLGPITLQISAYSILFCSINQQNGSSLVIGYNSPGVNMAVASCQLRGDRTREQVNYCRKMKCLFWCCAVLAFLSSISTANGQQRKKDVRKVYTFYNNIFRVTFWYHHNIPLNMNFLTGKHMLICKLSR